MSIHVVDVEVLLVAGMSKVMVKGFMHGWLVGSS